MSGYGLDPNTSGVFGVRFDPAYKPPKVGPRSPVQFSGLINHCITIVTN